MTKGSSPNLYFFLDFFFLLSFTYNFLVSTLDYYNIARFNNKRLPPTSGPPRHHVTTPLCHHHHYNCHFSHHHHNEHDEEGNDGDRGSVLQFFSTFLYIFFYRLTMNDNTNNNTNDSDNGLETLLRLKPLVSFLFSYFFH